MLKSISNSDAAAVEAQALAKLHELLNPVPFVSFGAQSSEPALAAGSWHPNLSVNLQAGGEPWRLIVDIKGDGQPRNVRYAALQLKDYVQRFASADARAYPVVVAPFISPGGPAAYGRDQSDQQAEDRQVPPAMDYRGAPSSVGSVHGPAGRTVIARTATRPAFFREFAGSSR